MGLQMTTHSGRASRAGDRIQEQQTKLEMEQTFNNITEWMDSMRLKTELRKKQNI